MSTLKRVSLWLMSAFYAVNGINHLVNPSMYLALMPEYLPAHMPLIVFSGVAELALGIAILFEPARKIAAWGIIALLIAIFPANIHVAVHDVPVFGSPEGLGIWNWVRLPFQIVFIAWAWWYTQDD